eukprot:TRINITY_DN18982_c0_g1_i1.p2 TRINITY_DN18982_c0_g1~~TRINITY_DN18982_c0_g1_i1.p2  ORF type:complete len:447 (+),score=167.00 TRINITY_DN18982_c0_g1_i1:83-1342(+)
MPASHKVKVFLGKVLPIKIPTPEVIAGPDSLLKMGELAKRMGMKKPLIVTDEILVSLGHVGRCRDALKASGLDCVIFDKVVPNPHTELVDQGEALYKEHKCDGLIAFGGGSPMDCGKIIGARIANPKPYPDYEGFGKVSPFGWYKLPPLIAVPTTAGTASETTVAAVITFAAEKRKVAMSDPALVPPVAVLDPRILVGLPKPITAATGVDALTHAVESFVSQWATDFTRKHSLRSVERIFRSLRTCYHTGDDIRARDEMLRASFEAGIAFTRAAVGYVHAIAHQLGGLFHTPHGVANAMVLPHILEFYIKKDCCTAELAALAIAAGLGSHYEEYDEAGKMELARGFHAAVKDLCTELQIPQTVPQMKPSDVATVAKRALAEAHGLGFATDLGYPVPTEMSMEECEEIVRRLVPAPSAKL